MKNFFVVLFLGLNSAWANEVWFTSNVGTPDFLDMFSQPNKWENARSKINIMKFYVYQFTVDDTSQCKWCGDNIYPNFVARNVFEKLNDWGIDIAIEAGSVKPGSCDGEVTAAEVIRAFRRVKAQGSVIKHISMDEPFISGEDPCNQSPEETARYTANWMKTVREAHRDIYGADETLRIGLIEAYPHFSMDQIINYNRLLKRYGATFEFIHIDPDHWAIRNKKMSDAKVRSDYTKLKSYAQGEEVPVGMYFWGHGDGKKVDHAKYERDVMDLINKTKRWYGGAPEHIQIQSWADSGPDERVVPNNLPESWKYSHMSILVRALQMFGLK